MLLFLIFFSEVYISFGFINFANDLVYYHTTVYFEGSKRCTEYAQILLDFIGKLIKPKEQFKYFYLYFYINKNV